LNHNKLEERNIFLRSKSDKKRWNNTQMQLVAQQLFDKTHKRKYLAHPNHEIHTLAREINNWLPKGVTALVNGTYIPRYLKRCCFFDETVDALYLTDRIFQHLLLKQLKPTLPHIINKNCLHIYGPSGVKRATKRIRETLALLQPNFFIRADIKSFYSSIPHHKLIKNMKQTFDDPKVYAMLERVISNGIETSRGFKNKDHGIALRGPLSQLFSAIYLKPLDDAFNDMDVTYVRYQDDIFILCKI